MELSTLGPEVRQSAAEFLDRTADLIERHGWRQGDRGTFVTGFCAVGGLDAAVLEARLVAKSDESVTLGRLSAEAMAWVSHLQSSDAYLFMNALAQELAEWLIAEGQISLSQLDMATRRSPEGASPILVMWWNDNPDRTASDVINALRKSAIALQEKVSDHG